MKVEGLGFAEGARVYGHSPPHRKPEATDAMKRNALAIVLEISLCLLLPLAAAAEERVIAETPVRAITSSDPEIFPASWRKPPVAAAGAALSDEQIARVRPILERALRRYPAPVLQTELRSVYVLAELRYRGVVTAGTNSRTCVYLKIGEVSKGFTDDYIEGVFHAEFSSILLRNHVEALDEKAWRAANPSGFTYLGDGVDAVRQKKAGLRRSEALHEEGFLVEYSRSTLENDLNGFASGLFRGDATLWEVAERFPRIKRKLGLTLNFYRKIDTNFTEAFFRSLVKSR